MRSRYGEVLRHPARGTKPFRTRRRSGREHVREINEPFAPWGKLRLVATTVAALEMDKMGAGNPSPMIGGRTAAHERSVGARSDALDLRWLLIGSLYVVAYVALDYATYVYPLGALAITPWNPPPGLSLALLLICGLRYVPFLFAAALVPELAVRGEAQPAALAVASAFLIALGYATVAVILTGRLRIDPRLRTMRDVTALVTVTAAASLLLALIYVLLHASARTSVPIAEAVMRFWIGDFIGIVVTTPLLLVLFGRMSARPRPTIDFETILQVLTMAVGLGLVLWLEPASEYDVFYVLFVPLIWIALRHGLTGVVVTNALLQVITFVALAVTGRAAVEVVAFQFLMLTFALTGLFLGVTVSERQQARAAARRRTAELDAVLRGAPDGIVTLGADARVLTANPAAGLLFGTDAQEIVGRSLGELLAGPAIPVRAGGREERLAVRRDGERIPVEVIFSALGDPPERRFVGILRDLSDRKAFEDALREKQAELDRSLRLLGAGEMSAALAHELNQPLSAISAYLHATRRMIARGPGELDRIGETIEAAVKEVKRAGAVTHRVREFFCSGAAKVQPVDVEAILQGVADTARPRAQYAGICLAVETAPGTGRIAVDRVQMEIVLHNLVSNAIDALRSGPSPVRAITLRGAPAAVPGQVRIEVHDTGPGIAPDITEQLFEAFSTTKPGGMGLGLAISRSIVEAHGGVLAHEPAADGCLFTITLAGCKDDQN